MGMRGKDLTGQVFGKLTVIEQAENPTTHRGNYWLCSCECGGEKVILGSYLRRGYYKKLRLPEQTCFNRSGIWTVNCKGSGH